MYGLVAEYEKRKGDLMQKSWTMACNRSVFGHAISRTCNHPKGSHVVIGGQNTNVSESYPRAFAERLHAVFAKYPIVDPEILALHPGSFLPRHKPVGRLFHLRWPTSWNRNARRRSVILSVTV